MIRRLQAAFIVMLLGSVPIPAAPVVQQVGQIGPTELVLQTAESKALVRHQATVHLREGRNLLAFSWNEEEQIDSASVRIQGENLQIGETVRPARADRKLQWTVSAPDAGERPITITYMLDGINWSPHYRMRVPEGGSQLTLTGEIEVTNDSGLALDNLDAKLVLGRPGTGSERDERMTFSIADVDALAVGETVRTGFLSLMEMPAEFVYRIDSERANRVEQVMLVQPPETGVLGREALPTGSASLTIMRGGGPDRIIRTKLEYEPADEFEIRIGPERDLMVERTLLEQQKTNVEFDRIGAVSGFDTIENYRLQVTSYLAHEVEIEVAETVLDTWQLRTDADYELEDGRAFMRITVPPGGEVSLEFTLTKHSGTRIP